MSKPSEADALLKLFTELDNDAQRITAKASAIGELRTAIAGTRLRARIGRLKDRLSRDESMQEPRVTIIFPEANAEQKEATENAVVIDLPRSRMRTLR